VGCCASVLGTIPVGTTMFEATDNNSPMAWTTEGAVQLTAAQGWYDSGALTSICAELIHADECLVIIMVADK